MNSELTKSLSGHIITGLASFTAWAVTNGYLDQAAAETLSNGLEPLIEGSVTLAVFLVTYFVQRWLRAKGWGAIADLLADKPKSKLPLILLFAASLLILCPSCADYRVSGGVFATGEGAKAGLAFDDQGNPTLSGRLTDAETGRTLGGTVTLSGK